jgi:hypothetical protein
MGSKGERVHVTHLVTRRDRNGAPTSTTRGTAGWQFTTIAGGGASRHGSQVDGHEDIGRVYHRPEPA